MRIRRSGWRTAGLLALCAALVACERPPVEVEQLGFRGTAMESVVNPRLAAPRLAAQTVPEPLPPANPDGPKAGAIYQNVEVLGDLSIGQFTRLMQAMTAWVAPEQGCQYCHAAGEALSSDKLYTKVVARRMLQMNQSINTDWNNHVGNAGVTCFTCHRGQNVPTYGWFRAPESAAAPRMVGYTAGQNRPAPEVGLASLPYDPFTPLLAEDGQIGVASERALPMRRQTGASIQETERTYALMMHMSSSLGVNCTYCHNSRAFRAWGESRPQRTKAWYAIRLVRAVNGEYLDSLQDVFPEHRLGPLGDVQKVNCATCHQQLPRPLNGISMLADYPELSAGT